MAEGIGGPVSSPLQPAKDVNTNDHSEAMFHQLDDFKKMMAADRMGFLYKRWMEHQCSDPGRRGQWRSQPVWGEGWQEREDNDKGGLWQLKIINFGFMWDAHGRLTNLATSGEALKGAGNQVVQRVQAAWTSKAGEAAAGRFTEFRDAAADYTAQVQNLGAQMEGAWHATRHVVKELADFANKSDLGGKPMMDRYGADGASDDHGNSERGNWSSRMDALNEAIVQGTYRWGPEAHEVIDPSIWSVDFSFGRVVQTPESVRQPGQVYIEADGSNMWSNEICNWLDDMAHCYFLTIGNFRRRVEETIRTVQEAWEKLNTQAGKITKDPFGKLSLGPAQGTGDDTKKSTDSGHDRPGTGNTGTAGTSGMGSTPVPPIAPPPMPPVQPAVDDTTNPSAVDGDVVPVVPQDQTKETVTIQDGDRKISVQSPDGEGHVKVTVDDGTGKPKAYDLDFSAGTGAPAQPGDGRPQTLPALETPSQQVQAGPDGKAVVHDGNLTITAERPPGTPDQIKITVDDGTGKPTTYLVDYADPANGTVTTQPGRPTAEPYPAPQSGFTDPSGQSGPAPGASAGFAAAPSGFADHSAAQQSGFSEPVPGAAAHFAEPMNGGRPDTGTSTQAGFTEPGFTQPTTGGFTDPSTPQQGGFTEPITADARRFAGTFPDATSGQQTGSLDPIGTESHAYAQPTSQQSAGFPEYAVDEAGRFAEPLNGGFTDPQSGFIDSATSADFAEDISVDGAGFVESETGGFADPSSAQPGFADSSAAQQAAGFPEYAVDEGRFAEPLSSGFSEPAGAQSGFADQESGFATTSPSSFAEPGDGDFGDLDDVRSGFAVSDTAAQGGGFPEPGAGDDFADQAMAQGAGFTDSGFVDPAAQSVASEGFEPVEQADVFDPAAAQAIDADSGGGFEPATEHEGGFDQGATAQASGIAAGPSIGDDLFRDWSTGLSDSDIDEYQSPESAPYERSEQLSQAEAWTEPEPSTGTAAQSLGFDVVSGDDSAMDSIWSTQGDLFDDSEPRDVSGEEIAPAAGEAGLAAVPDNGQSQPHPASPATAGGGMGGMPMMGMGGGGGGGNNDQERGPSAWSTTGDLFDDGPMSAADRISTVLDDDEQR
ncbi:hypothetical protein JOF56_002903 [Kibdelosporangium banguiense]|uniref:WXG100 family type VII secretion target n=1 Tax=Kibdelosporangium banguiense TaxID=1365924 RepID=A0ABS4TDL4_9PSEU|nr:hypothetical protein [Kibdelosporangium banguiense]MBP2322518.1 hypothetical protein [Kibdelosporangium banguiense]